MYRIYLVAETISLQPSSHEQSHIKNNYKEKPIYHEHLLLLNFLLISVFNLPDLIPKLKLIFYEKRACINIPVTTF